MKYLTIENHPNDSRVLIKEDEICQTLSQRMGTGGGNVPLVLGFDAYNQNDTGDVAKTLNAKSSDADHVPVVMVTDENVQEAEKSKIKG